MDNMTEHLYAHIHKDQATDAWTMEAPWFFTVDYVTPECPKGDFSLDSFEYGRCESFEMAVRVVNTILAEAAAGTFEPLMPSLFQEVLAATLDCA